MASRVRRRATGVDRVKYAFFALMGLCFLLVLWVDERFLFIPGDPEWKHIAAFKWLLLVHALAGLTALGTGTLQMSGRIRKGRPALHRLLGKIYIGAVCVAAPIAIYIGVSPVERAVIRLEQIFQGGFWLLSALIAWACIRSGQMALHKSWMIRSYAFTLVFVLSRVPDAFKTSTSDLFEANMLWTSVLVGLIAPEIILTALTLLRTRPARSV